MSSVNRAPLPHNPFGPSTSAAGLKKNPFLGGGGERDERLVGLAHDMIENHGDDPAAGGEAVPPPRRDSKFMRLIGKTVVWASYTILAYVVLLALNYYGIWDPCSVKFSYRRQCNVDFYGWEDVLSYTEYEEDFFCLIPGIGYHQEEKGWNLDFKCK